MYAIVNLGISLMHKCSAKLDADWINMFCSSAFGVHWCSDAKIGTRNFPEGTYLKMKSV